MTCGIAIPVKGKVVLASGSRLLAGTHKLSDTKKIIKLGDFIALVSGVVKSERLSLLQFQDIDISKHSCDEIVETWADLLVGLSMPEDEGVEFILAFEEDLWFIDSDGVVIKSNKDFLTIGSGADMARGFLGASKKPKTVEEAKKLALRCLKYVSLHMVCEGPPFTTEVT